MQTKSAEEGKKITFEQPLNEYTRICLRLEYLFNELNDHLHHECAFNSQISVVALLRIMDVIDRPDLKSKFAQVLTQFTTTLSQLERFPQVDLKRLKNILQDLDSLIDYLHQTHGKIGQNLRNHEFLNQVRLQLNSPGGICDYNAPALTLWLQQPYEKRRLDLASWTAEFEQLSKLTHLTLQLIRQSTSPQVTYAEAGFHHRPLDPMSPCQLVCITLPEKMNIYPKVSVGKHRLTIRFLVPDFAEGERAKQIDEDFEFELRCCRF